MAIGKATYEHFKMMVFDPLGDFLLANFTFNSSVHCLIIRAYFLYALLVIENSVTDLCYLPWE